MFTAEEVAEKVNEFDDEQRVSQEYWEGTYEELKNYGWSSSGKNAIEVPGLGELEYVDEYGGEGKGDDYWVVFKIGEQYFRVDGWYASYDGGELDGEPYEVSPKEQTITTYEAK